MYQIHKFGGASVKDAEGIRQVGKILGDLVHPDMPTIAVISAMGKTTNRLEQVVRACFNEDDPYSILQEIIQWHLKIVQELQLPESVVASLNDVFVEGEWIIEDAPLNDYNYVYDQIVALGELASTVIITAYLQLTGYQVLFLDIRDVIKTDESFRQARILWDKTAESLDAWVSSLSGGLQVVVTQGFIGSSLDNQTTTLGREGSDYTGAILAYLLDAKRLTVWKDVPGIMTADPRKTKDATVLDELSYLEAIEMAYYGAKVIHPKTIKPLENKKIPLFVRSFTNPSEVGTIIKDIDRNDYPPIIITEEDQYLIKVATKDFTFISEMHLAKIFRHLSDFKLKVNVMKNSAISFSVCVSGFRRSILQLLDKLKQEFTVDIQEGLRLITIRHYTEQLIDELLSQKSVYLEEKGISTVQFVVNP